MMQQKELDFVIKNLELITLSDNIFLFLLELQKKNPELTFWLRTKDSNRSVEERLQNGFWFQGSDYVYVGFTAKTDGQNKTQTIGINASYIPEMNLFRFSLVLIFRGENDEEICDAYTILAELLNLKKIGLKSYERELHSNNFRDVFSTFVNNDLKRIVDFFNSNHKTAAHLIQPKRFAASLSNILTIRDSLISKYGVWPPVRESLSIGVNSNNVNFWILSYDSRSWPIEFEIGARCWFHKNYSNGLSRNVDVNFNEIKKNDIVFTFSIVRDKGNKWFHKITESLYDSKEYSGKVIEFTPCLGFSKIPLSYNDIATNIVFKDGEIGRNNFDIGLYKLNENEINYLFSHFKISKNIFIPNNQSSKIENETDKIPFHLDKVENVDRLNRESSAKSLTRLLNNEIFNRNNDAKHGFMIHLQGEWGDGKSTFLNLIERNLVTDDRKWIVVKYNAWRNQHIEPPWWSFLNDIYTQSFEQMKGKGKILFWFKENFRRIIKYQSTQKLFNLIIAILLGCVIFHFRLTIYEFSSKSLQSESLTNESKGIALEVFVKLIAALGAFAGLIYSLSKFLSAPLFLRSANSAKSFMERSVDPMKMVKLHFEGLVDDVNKNGNELAIFIDDLDRCNSTFTVSLLEGIQTLFKDKRVLFVVAADRHWICQSFENYYKDYSNVTKKPAQKLGYLFVEKAFQLSIRLPKISSDTKMAYWNYILNIKSLDKSIPPPKKKDQERIVVMNEIKNKSTSENLFNPNYLNSLRNEYEMGEDEIVDIALELIDKDEKDLKHRLLNHHTLIDTNPRSIKRLANEYTMYRNMLVAEGKMFDRDKLFRWLILMNKYPEFTDWIEANHDKKIDQLPIDLTLLVSNDIWKTLYYDPQNKNGGPISSADVSLFTGIVN